jgi:MATE family multidrug resistance protein
VFVIYAQALIGAGATLSAMTVTATMNLIRIPLVHGLAVGAGFGLPGVWWAINLSSFGKFSWISVLFRRGRWQQQRV